LRATFHGKQGVCDALPAVAGGPLPAKEGVDAYLARLRAYFFVQSGHGHWSQPQPVHAWRIMAKSYSRIPAEVRLRQFQKRGSARCLRSWTTRLPDADVGWRFVEVEIAAAPGWRPQANEVERADE
jgi:hypothetical protein